MSNGSTTDKTDCHREESAGPSRGRKALDRQLQKALDANLRELELLHKRVRPPHVEAARRTSIPRGGTATKKQPTKMLGKDAMHY